MAFEVTLYSKASGWLVGQAVSIEKDAESAVKDVAEKCGVAAIASEFRSAVREIADETAEVSTDVADEAEQLAADVTPEPAPAPVVAPAIPAEPDPLADPDFLAKLKSLLGKLA